MRARHWSILGITAIMLTATLWVGNPPVIEADPNGDDDEDQGSGEEQPL